MTSQVHFLRNARLSGSRPASPRLGRLGFAVAVRSARFARFSLASCPPGHSASHSKVLDGSSPPPVVGFRQMATVGCAKSHLIKYREQSGSPGSTQEVLL